MTIEGNYVDLIEDEQELLTTIQNLYQFSKMQYWSPNFWNAKYQSNCSHFEWLAYWPDFRDLVTQYLKKSAVALDVGCGTSHLGRDLVDEGFQKVVCLDFSEVVINKLKEKRKGEHNLEFHCADVAKMRLPRKSFDVVFDKGTLDCVLSGSEGQKNGKKAILEISRVLKMNGIYVLLTYGLEQCRDGLLKNKTGFSIVMKTKIAKSDEECTSYTLYVLQKVQDAAANSSW